MKRLKNYCSLIVSICAVFFFGFSVMVACLICSAMIPRSKIQPQMENSAKYLCKKAPVYQLISGNDVSSVDRYADAIWISIAYSFEEDNPLESTAWCNYYYYDDYKANENLKRAIMNGLSGNKEYLRYWHGAAALIRFWHLFSDIYHLYGFLWVCTASLISWLVVLLIRHNYIREVVSLILGLVSVSIWFLPFCLEFIWTFILMLFICIVALKLVHKDKIYQLYYVFLISGMLTAFFDFLTTETLTLTVPLLLVISITSRNINQTAIKHKWSFTCKSCILWLLGFIGMWSGKWMYATIVLRQNIIKYVIDHIQERIVKNPGVSQSDFIFGSLSRNMFRLFPYGYGLLGASIVLVSIIVFVFCPIFSNRIALKKHISYKDVVLFLSIGMIPYVRFLILHNHSYLHCGFTYRAQMGTVMAVIIAFSAMIKTKSNPGALK